MFFEKITILDDCIVVAKTYHSGMINGIKRSPRKNVTSKAVEKHNQKLRIETLYHLLRMNFESGDTNISLHYRKGDVPGSEKEAKRDISKCLKMIKRKYPDAKYIYSTHTTKNGSIHHHLILSKDVPVFKIQEVWEKVTKGTVSLGHALYVDKNTYKKLAAYLLGEATDDEGAQKNKPREKNMRGYTGSRNLKSPVKKYRIVNAKGWRKKPYCPKGYKVIDLINGVDLYGFPYQHYVLIPIEETPLVIDDIDLYG